MDFGEIRLPRTEYSAEELEEEIKNGKESGFFSKIIADYQENVRKTQEANRYFINITDIIYESMNENKHKKIDAAVKNAVTNPLRNADNKEAHGFYQILVNQKISYLFSKKILLTSKNKKFNTYLKELSNRIFEVISELALYSSNGGRSWAYPYIDLEGNFKLAAMESTTIIPFYDSTIEKNLKYLLRIYDKTIELISVDGIYYYDKDKKGQYQKRFDEKGQPIIEYNYYKIKNKITGKEKKGKTWGKFPIIEFANNVVKTRDLDMVKLFVDAYDKIVSLYLNDIDDLQQLIFVLINYGGQNLEEFLNDLRQYKAVKVTKTGAGSDGGVETLKVDIPVDARIKLLDIIEENIWRLGQGVNPKKESIGDASGVALKHLYGLLELKAGLMEVQFRNAINKVIEIYKIYLKETGKGDYIKEEVDQIYTKTMITNDSEIIEDCVKSMSVLSLKTVIANHPYIDNVEEELKQIEEERAKKEEQYPFPTANNDVDEESKKAGEVDESK